MKDTKPNSSFTVLIRIAFRNMLEHKAKSAIIGVLMALGVIIIVLGNAFMDAADSGFKKLYIDCYTSDMIISAKSEKAFSVFGPESTMEGDFDTPIVPEYETILEKIKADPRIEVSTAATVAFAKIAPELTDAEQEALDAADDESDSMRSVFLVHGVDAETYFSVFPSIRITEGRTIQKGQAEVLLTQKQIERLEKKYKRNFALGDKLLITGFGDMGLTIREVSLVGIFTLDGGWDEDNTIAYTDVNTVRSLGGLVQDVSEAIVLDDSQTHLLAADDESLLFSDDSFSDVIVSIDKTKSGSKSAANQFTSAAALIGDTTKRDLLNTTDSGAWNFIMVRLKDTSALKQVVTDYNGWLTEKGLEAQARAWKEAAGTRGKSADIIRIIFNIALIIIGVVTIIIIMNTLVVSVIERTAEIGTMRALGAQRNFVRSMFLTETLTLTIVFGIIGSIIALAIIIVLNALKISSANEILMVLCGGGKYLYLTARFSSFITTIVMVFGIGWLAHLYPVAVALKISPVKAMSTE